MIIIPAYNVERYIKECIDSVLRQKTKFRYKIVVVDDGSTDHTRDILNLYSKEAQVIYQENGGGGFSKKYRTKKHYWKLCNVY